ncbi:Ku protein [Ciceribacter sp. L1K23]|uniref:non-homologous end joining protein Ku n=1 Tax=Ciceribacter sp. L1K23 TaxID=2820276 RepID=UPI001B823540|nr:Ku protein [Ciceribacter sp. L1K23]MBR0557950.1 Ku protein [Ciceribacter sp. L1K23]
MAYRALWKGELSVDELSCGVALYAATSSADRVSFHIINRKTGNRVSRRMVDSETGREVERDEIVKGYETSNGKTVILEAEEITSLVPKSDKALDVQGFLGFDDIDPVFFERPYFLVASDEESAEAFELIRRGMEKKKVGALARTVLFRRLRNLFIRPTADGMIATTLQYDYEVRSADEALKSIPDVRISREMLDLARHIIGTKQGAFDPAEFEDRYDDALAELVKAKIEGRKPKKLPRRAASNVTDLMDALRQSAGEGGKSKGRKKTAASDSGSRRKAG